ncbi:MAG: universal stress protein [Candidatus Bathyarchaeia archaeon]
MEPIFKNILLPIDGSVQNRVAQDMAIFLSKPFESQVTLMHVFPNEPISLPAKNYAVRENYAPISNAIGQFPRTLPVPTTKEYAIPDEVTAEIRESYLTEGRELLSQATLRFRQAKIATRERLLEGVDITDVIITEADAGDYDLVVIGNSEGEGKELDFHLGSVAEKVSSAIKTPILIVRQKAEITQILVPVEGSEKDEHSLEKAAIISKAVGAKMVLLHVQEPRLLRLKPETKEIGVRILKDAAAKLLGIQVEQKLELGDPAKVIIQTAEQDGADLIVMSRGGYSSLRNLFLGSVSSHVLHYAKVPLLLVK